MDKLERSGIGDSWHGAVQESSASPLTPTRATAASADDARQAISRDLARGMGGELMVSSRMGVGSTFTLSLPRVEDTSLSEVDA